MLKGLSALVLISSLLAGATALAEPAQPGAAPATASSPAAVRRDPRGVKGISPFREALNKGDSALLAHDLDGAIVAYRDAVSKDPQNALGQYRIGEAQIAKGDLKEAETAFLEGLRLVPGTDFALKAKLEFAIADLRERQQAYDDAIAKWTEYEAFTTEQKEAQGFPASGSERKKVVEAWKKLSADSAEVKARIQKGLQAADEAVRKSSK